MAHHSIDLSPELVALATVRLAEHGYHPCLMTSDGAAGVPGRAPFDRIIATCGVDRIPRSWIDQTRDGRKIMANVLGPFNAYALVLLTVEDGTASGRFLPQSGNFMPRRTDPARAFDYTVTVRRGATDATTGHSTLDPRDAYDDPTWGLLAQSHLHGVTCRRIFVDDDQHLATELATSDGSSWAVVHHDHWVALGCPAYHRFGLTVDRNAQTLPWLDQPDSGHSRPTPVRPAEELR